jgi:PAS domain S-box-containing protein
MNRADLLNKLRALDTNLADAAQKEFTKLEEERDTFKLRLNLLDRAVSNDYDSILVTDLGLENPGPKIVFANSGFSHLTGYALDEVIGQSPRLLQGPKTDRATLDRLKKNLIEGQSFFGQTVNYRKDGSEFVNQWDIHPLQNENGEITHWVSYQHDVSERKTAELNISFDPATEFDKLDELGKSILIDFDQQGNVVYANKAFREMTGYHVDNLKTRKIWELIDYEDFDEMSFESGAVTNFNGEKGLTANVISQKKKLLDISFDAEWLDLDGQAILRLILKNLSLKSRVLEAIKKINNTGTNGTMTLESVSPIRVEMHKTENGLIIHSLSPDFQHKFGTFQTPILAKDISLPFAYKIDELAKEVTAKGSVCEHFYLNDESFTAYLKYSDDNAFHCDISFEIREEI